MQKYFEKSDNRGFLAIKLPKFLNNTNTQHSCPSRSMCHVINLTPSVPIRTTTTLSSSIERDKTFGTSKAVRSVSLIPIIRTKQLSTRPFLSQSRPYGSLTSSVQIPSIFSYYKTNKKGQKKHRSVVQEPASNHLDMTESLVHVEAKNNINIIREGILSQSLIDMSHGGDKFLTNKHNSNDSDNSFAAIAIREIEDDMDLRSSSISSSISSTIYLENILDSGDHERDSLTHHLPANLQNNQTIQRFMNFLTKKGKKSIAKSIFLKTLYLLNKRRKLFQSEIKQQESKIINTGKSNDKTTALQLQSAMSISMSKSRQDNNTNDTGYRDDIDRNELTATLSGTAMLPVHRRPMSSSTLSCNLGSRSELSISPLKIIYAAINQVKPLFEVKKIRVAGATYQVPSLIKSGRQKNIGINWLIKSAFERKKKTSSQTISGIKMGRRGPKVPKLGENLEGFLAVEVFEAFQRQGQARNKRNELHKLAEQNRAFSHFRWW